MPSDKKTTISDVAARSGVSKTTVSRYLNGKYDNISIATRQRIKAVIDELDYSPNRTAQRLKASRTMLVGCVIGDISSPFSAVLLKGIMGACEAAGYQVLFADCNDDPEKERMAIKSLVANRVDGLIVNTSGGNEELFLDLKAQGIPVVLADRGLVSCKEIDSVTAQNRKAAYDCVKLLKDYAGYCDAMRDLFPGVPVEQYVFDKTDEESCRRQIEAFRFAHPGERIAILTVNGVTTQRVMLSLNTLGYGFSSFFGLCGFDDWSWLQLHPSGVTSVSMPTKKLGEDSAKLLIERMTGSRGEDAPVFETGKQIDLNKKLLQI